MPNTDDIARRAELRKARKEAQQSAVEKAQSEAATQAATSEQQAAEKVATAKAVVAGEAPKPVAKPIATPTQRAKTKQEAKAATKRAAEVQAERDIRKAPEPVDLRKLEAEALPGSNLSLHQLNAIAEKADRELRDEGKEIAEAAAKGAYSTYIGKVEGRRNRHAKLRAQMEAGNAARAAAAAAKQEQQ